MRQSTQRRLLAVALAVSVLVALPACAISDDPSQDATDADGPPATTIADFCIPFPTRDASVMLEAPDHPSLDGNAEVTDSLLEMGATGLAEKAPAELGPAVETYVAALRGWEPGDDLTEDPDTRSAVTAINAWLQVNCPPPTVPPATVPPATAPGTTG